MRTLDSQQRFTISKVIELLTQSKVDTYLVGGYVRDNLMGRLTADIDFAVSPDAPEIARNIADAIGGSYVLLNQENGIARVVVSQGDDLTNQWHLDFSSLRSTIEADLGRRDFTIDAMAIRLPQKPDGAFPFCISASEIIDPFGGQNDLKTKCVKAVSTDVFRNDPVRLLRAVRLAHEYDFSIDGETESLIKRDSYLLDRAPGERVRDELCHILTLTSSASSLCYLDQLGLLDVVFPELAVSKGVEQPKEHFWDVFDHSVETVRAEERLLANDVGIVACVPWIEDIGCLLDISIGLVRRDVLLKLAALLHDVAKPKTKNLESDGRVHFFGHASEGAMMAGDIMERLRFSNQQTKMVQLMIEHHMRVWQMSNEGMPTRRAVYRYFKDTADVWVETLILSLADFMAKEGPRLNNRELVGHAELMHYIICEHERDVTLTRPPKLISGHDLIAVLGMEPGPQVGILLESVREAQSAGQITTREEALAFVKNEHNCR